MTLVKRQLGESAAGHQRGRLDQRTRRLSVTQRLSVWMMYRAVRRLPEELWERYAEEWGAILIELRGFQQVWTALGFFIAARTMSSDPEPLFGCVYETAPNPYGAETNAIGPVGGYWKRCFDIVVASTTIMIMAPTMILIALLLTTAGPRRP